VDEAAVRDRRDDPDLVVSGLDRETVVEPPGAVRLRADDGAGVLEDGLGELGLDAVAGGVEGVGPFAVEGPASRSASAASSRAMAALMTAASMPESTTASKSAVVRMGISPVACSDGYAGWDDGPRPCRSLYRGVLARVPHEG
jgi:hypothetical protein